MLFFCLVLLMCTVRSVPVQPVRLCINCKHFLLNPSLSGYANPENGKCALFPEQKEDNKNYLITGDISSVMDYKKCVVVRNTDDMCGEEGKYYESGGNQNYEKLQFYKKIRKVFSESQNQTFLKCPNLSF